MMRCAHVRRLDAPPDRVVADERQVGQHAPQGAHDRARVPAAQPIRPGRPMIVDLAAAPAAAHAGHVHIVLARPVEERLVRVAGPLPRVGGRETGRRVEHGFVACAQAGRLQRPGTPVVPGHVRPAGRGRAGRGLHVLPDGQTGADRGDSVALFAPQSAAGALMHAGSQSGVAHRLAGRPADEHVRGGERGLVDLGDIPQVGGVGAVERLDGAGPGLQVGGDDGVRAAERGGDTHLQAAVTGEQGIDFGVIHTLRVCVRNGPIPRFRDAYGRV